MSQPITVKKLKDKKKNGEKFTVLTAYDSTMATLCEKAGVDVILVGDSLGMVVQGHKTTVPVTMDDVIYHARCVDRATSSVLKMLDMPFMSYAHQTQAIENAMRLMQEGLAEVIKIECNENHAGLITDLSRNGVPVCAHLGLTPQIIHKLGSYRKRGKSDAEANQIVSDSLELEQAGADLILLECVPPELAKRVTESVSIPVIGIGAGCDVDAQVLVSYDILGVSEYIPTFAKNFLAEAGSIEGAIRLYVESVKNGSFPSRA
ncbi:MAG: 3-methyl-2-oxobutanoate hydroxymethyltransferase [Gammaproteobacteria bacterium]|nr:3-methyl-2-oxobutanoate hydroxymethyltransferase [Gammaproteobacteria bacterium]